MSKKIWGTLDPFIEFGDVLGRKVANSSFLHALLKIDPFDEYHFFLKSKDLCHGLNVYLQEHMSEVVNKNKIFFFEQTELHLKIKSTNYYCFHLSDCFTSSVALAQIRNKYSKYIFPITGTTHSLSYQRFLPLIMEYLWPGCTLRDCIVATSSAAKNLLEKEINQLRQDYFFDKTVPNPSLEVIPLGVNDFNGFKGDACVLSQSQQGHANDNIEVASLENEANNLNKRTSKGAKIRKKLEIRDDSCIILYIGRISTYSKMDIVPLLHAGRRLKQLCKDDYPFTLVVAGWLEEKEGFVDSLKSYAKLCGVDFRLISCPDDDEKNELLLGSDVFVSAVDNIQETFGLSVLEAGSFGLPVVASCFSGYKDLIINEETGFLIDTIGFSDTRETDCLSLLWADNQYHLRLAQSTAIDIGDLTAKLEYLVKNSNARIKMGERAREYVLSKFSWESCVKSHIKLWEKLWSYDILNEDTLRKFVHPLAMKFSSYFSGYFSYNLDKLIKDNAFMVATDFGQQMYQADLFVFYSGLEELLPKDMLRQLISEFKKPTSVKEVYANLFNCLKLKIEQDNDVNANISFFCKEKVDFMILWALKQDYIEIVKS